VAPPVPPSPPLTYVDEESGDYCRDYSQIVRIGGQVQESYGTACLQPDGSWRVVQ
jgi:surface antigen